MIHLKGPDCIWLIYYQFISRLYLKMTVHILFGTPSDLEKRSNTFMPFNNPSRDLSSDSKAAWAERNRHKIIGTCKNKTVKHIFTVIEESIVVYGEEKVLEND